MKCCTDLSEFDNNAQSPYGFFFCGLPPPRGSGITPDNLCFAFQMHPHSGGLGGSPSRRGQIVLLSIQITGSFMSDHLHMDS